MTDLTTVADTLTAARAGLRRAEALAPQLAYCRVAGGPPEGHSLAEAIMRVAIARPDGAERNRLTALAGQLTSAGPDLSEGMAVLHTAAARCEYLFTRGADLTTSANAIALHAAAADCATATVTLTAACDATDALLTDANACFAATGVSLLD